MHAYFYYFVARKVVGIVYVIFISPPLVGLSYSSPWNFQFIQEVRGWDLSGGAADARYVMMVI